MLYFGNNYGNMAMGQKDDPWGPQVLVFFTYSIGFFRYPFWTHCHMNPSNMTINPRISGISSGILDEIHFFFVLSISSLDLAERTDKKKL